MQGVENNKVNKWIFWVNNIKQIGKTPQTISLHQSGAVINHLPKLFTGFFFFNGSWKWTLLAILQYTFVWKSLPLLISESRQGCCNAHCCLPTPLKQTEGWGRQETCSRCNPDSGGESEQGLSIFWVLWWFLQNCSLAAELLEWKPSVNHLTFYPRRPKS